MNLAVAGPASTEIAPLIGGATLGDELTGVVVEDVSPDELIVTPAEQWAFAVTLARGDNVPDAPFALSISLRVETGNIGVGALNRAGDAFETEWWTEGAPADLNIVLPIRAGADFGGLVIRNVSETGPSSARLLKVTAHHVVLGGPHSFLATQDDRAARREQELIAEFDALGFQVSRMKWSEVPNHGVSRIDSSELNALSDDDLLTFYDQAFQRSFKKSDGGVPLLINWYYAVYREAFRGKRVLDVGSGCGFDALWFSQHGAAWTCADVAETNLENIQRITELRGFKVDTLYLETLESIDAMGEFDFIWCNGSMINAPFGFAAAESRRLIEHLPVGGRWIELGYPRERWIREGQLPLHRWGERTDGIGTPWMEWYDTPKLLARLQPASFDVYMAFNYAEDTLNWFDLLRTG